MRKYALVVAAVLVLAPAGWAQSVISAKSGTIHHVDGKASIAGTNLKPNKTGEFPVLEQGQTLVTQDAHAEVLLTPGVFLRLGEQAQLEMVNNKLTDTRVKLLDGAALVEVGEIVEGNHITVQVGEYSASLLKQGIYSFNASPARVKVLEGRAEVLPLQGEGHVTVVKGGRELTAANTVPVKFNKKQHDELYAWSSRRAALVARANIVAANSAGQRGNGFSSSSGSSRTSGWVYMPSFGFYTYLPGNGMWASPFGYNYYSPSTIYMLYQPAYSNNGVGGGSSQQAANAAIGTRGGSWEGMGGGGGISGGGVAASAASGSWGGAASGAAPARSGGGAAPSGGGGAAPGVGGSGRR